MYAHRFLQHFNNNSLPPVQVVPCSDVDKVMAELKGHAPGITRYVLDIANTIDDFENLAGK